MKAQALKNLQRYKWYPGVVYNPPIVGDVNGLLGAINMGNANGGTNWPGGGYDPETHMVYAGANTAQIGAESVAPPPDGFSDIAYQAGTLGRPFQLREAAGAGTYADAPRNTGRGGAGRGRGAGGGAPGGAPGAAGAGREGGGGAGRGGGGE